MKQLVVVTASQPLLRALTDLADLYGAKIIFPLDFTELAFSDPVAIVLDPHSLPLEIWQTYIDYISEPGEEDSTPLVLLKQRDEDGTIQLPERIRGKQEGSVFCLYADEVTAVTAIVDEAMLGTRNQWNLSPKQCQAPNMLEVEETYLAMHLEGEYVVVVSRPADEAASMPTFERLAALAGFDTPGWQAAPFLSFCFATEEAARRFAARVPHGMATLYAHGQYLAVNC